MAEQELNNVSPEVEQQPVETVVTPVETAPQVAPQTVQQEVAPAKLRGKGCAVTGLVFGCISLIIFMLTVTCYKGLVTGKSGLLFSAFGWVVCSIFGVIFAMITILLGALGLAGGVKNVKAKLSPASLIIGAIALVFGLITIIGTFACVASVVKLLGGIAEVISNL